MAKISLTPKTLHELLKYEPNTGHFYWRPRRVKWFADERSSKIWNTKFAGKRAICTIRDDGYLSGTILEKTFLAHRVAWAMATNEWVEEVDHINGLKADNRLSNLRAADHVMNGRNRPKESDSTTPRIGVFWRKDRSVWVAQIGVGKDRNLILGRFKTLEEAIAAREEAEIRYGYHPNHGRKAS